MSNSMNTPSAGSVESKFGHSEEGSHDQERTGLDCVQEMSDARAENNDLRSFGRRRGRKATLRQRALLDELLPRVTIDPDRLTASGVHDSTDLAALCGSPGSQVWLEIGFGGGEHLIWQARNNPHVVIIGSEPFEDGIVKVLTAIESGGLDHVRLFADDVRPLLRTMPDASISRVFILFPDPWPKRRHQKRRLIGPALIAELARVMRDGAQLRFATDIGDYARTSLLALNENVNFEWCAKRPIDWRERPTDWPPTRYEQKAIREGRRRYYFQFRRI